MKTSIYVLLLWLIPTIGYTQKKMSLQDAVIGRYGSLRPESLRSLQWKDETTYLYVKDDTLWSNSAKQNISTISLSLNEFNKAVENAGITFSAFPPFLCTSGNQIEIMQQNHILLYNTEKKIIELNLSIPPNAEYPDFCRYNKTVAYVKGQNLFILDENGEKQITFETQPGIICGVEVHRQEFGITKGTFWSKSGKYLAFYRKDESMVKDYPLVDYMVREAEYTPVKYPMAGMTSHQVTVGIYNLETGKTTFLNTGKPDDHYLTNLSWGPEDQFIYLAELNRDQNHMHLNQYQTETGKKVKTLFEETSSTYVEPVHPIQFSKTNPEQFYYWSRKDGWFHLYLYNINGKMIRQITKGEWEVTDFYGADRQEKNIFIQSTMKSPVDRHIYKVDITSGKTQKLSRESGTHAASFSPGMDLFIDEWEAFDIPSRTDLISTDGQLIRNIHQSTNPLAEYELGENRIFTIKAADNKTDLFCRMILPNGFKPEKKYPVVVYVYGGPHAQLINNRWLNAADWWQYYLAAKGYIAFTIDSRGSDNRGKMFEEIIHRQLGITETADQMKGIGYLKSLPFVDRERIGVYGWSYGGFMTLNLKLRQPETFKVGVAGGPVVDWRMYEVMYGERYMDRPEENPEGYNNSNMITLVNNLSGKLMLIHGVQDETVVMQHSMMFLRECIKQNKQVDFFAYPTHPHNVGGKDRLHLMTKICQYFFDYL
ncbi:MAG: DPP IV N-terminal domain-containing protein [Mangrovibacterium sp.]